MARTDAKITIGARTDKASFARVEQETKGFLSRMRGGTTGGAGGTAGAVERIDRGVSQMNKLVGIFAAAEIAGQSLEVVFEGISAAIAGVNGDIERMDEGILKVQESAKSIPIIGAGFSLGDFIGQLITGDRKAAEAIEEATRLADAALQKRLAVVAKHNADFNREWERAGDTLEKINLDYEASLREGVQREVFLMDEKTHAMQQAIQKQIDELNRLAVELPDKEAEITERTMQLFRAQIQLREMFIEESARLWDEDAKQQAEEARKLAEELADIEATNRAMMLRLTGDDLEAELTLLRHHYDRRIELAEDAAVREALARQKALAIEEARTRAEAQDRTSPRRFSPAGNPEIVEGRMLTGASRMNAQDWSKVVDERTAEANAQRKREAEQAAKDRGEIRQYLAEIARSGGDVGALLSR